MAAKNRQLAGGGSLMDMGIYAINAVRYLSGKEPMEVYGDELSTPGDPRFTEVEETMNFELRFEEGFIASCLTSYGINAIDFAYTGRGTIRVGAVSELSEAITCGKYDNGQNGRKCPTNRSTTLRPRWTISAAAF